MQADQGFDFSLQGLVEKYPDLLQNQRIRLAVSSIVRSTREIEGQEFFRRQSFPQVIRKLEEGAMTLGEDMEYLYLLLPEGEEPPSGEQGDKCLGCGRVIIQGQRQIQLHCGHHYHTDASCLINLNTLGGCQGCHPEGQAGSSAASPAEAEPAMSADEFIKTVLCVDPKACTSRDPNEVHRWQNYALLMYCRSIYPDLYPGREQPITFKRFQELSRLWGIRDRAA